MLGMLLFLVIALMVSWSSVKAIDTNYGLQKQISEIQQQNAVQQLANENQKLENEYFNTPQYLDIAARQDFGLALPGEKILLVPQTVAMTHTVMLPQDMAKPPSIPKSKPAYQRHFQAWMDFFFHSSNG